MNKNQNILKSILDECGRHLFRLNYAYNKISFLFPIDKGRVAKLSEDEVAYIDQIIFRFSKLHDAIGQKLFKAVLVFLDEEVSNKSAIDIFNKLAQLEVIENYEMWKGLRELRNELAHEYEEDESETAERLNYLFERKGDLEKYLNDIRSFLDKRGDIV